MRKTHLNKHCYFVESVECVKNVKNENSVKIPGTLIWHCTCKIVGRVKGYKYFYSFTAFYKIQKNIYILYFMHYFESFWFLGYKNSHFFVLFLSRDM